MELLKNQNWGVIVLGLVAIGLMMNLKYDIGRLDGRLEGIDNRLASLDSRMSSVEAILRQRAEATLAPPERDLSVFTAAITNNTNIPL